MTAILIILVIITALAAHYGRDDRPYTSEQGHRRYGDSDGDRG
jgi:hypothetical protein